MSAVIGLRVLRVPSPLARPFVTAVRRTDHIDAVLVEVKDAEGRSGWGEAAVSWRVTGESPQSVAAAVAGPLADIVIGRDANDPDLSAELATTIWGNAAARSAVECAIADLAAQQSGMRVADALGASAFGAGVPRSIRTDMTLSAAPPRELAAMAAEHVADGFRCLKVKVDARMDVLAALRAVRDEVGLAIGLRIDANQAWDAETAIRSIRSCEDAGVGLTLVEQPVAAHDLDALARVTAAVDTPVMADESVRTARDVHAIAERGAANLVNIKLAKTGGLAAALDAARAAQAAGLGLIFGSMMEAHVGVGATAQLAAAFAPDTVHDLDAALWLRQSPVSGGISYESDTILLSDGAGLGITGLAPNVRAEVLV
ncbi:MAG: enolase C-terminal domain-like protein [Microbacterium sp.]|uniref:enolase C-terminal domain-like protein n=1 Tax=Microbacterium sp. TaxID=51671 RepID=UPI003F9E508D